MRVQQPSNMRLLANPGPSSFAWNGGNTAATKLVMNRPPSVA